MKYRIREALACREKKPLIAQGRIPAAVLIPVYQKENDFHVLFTKRTQHVEHHKGQISFPGGAYDSTDSDLVDTALREAFEEIGLHPRDIEVLGGLDSQITVSSNFVISPFVGAIPYPYSFKLNRSEVAELIEVPFSTLLDVRCWKEQAQGQDDCQPEYVCYYHDHVIWGATARILKQFLGVVFG